MFQLERFIVGICLATSISLLLYAECSFYILIIIELATLYDCWSLYRQTQRFKLSLLIAGIISLGNTLLYTYYHLDSMQMIHLITVVQLSDVVQYLGGNYFGQHYVGSISPKKTYEGYLISLLVMMNYPFLSYTQILIYWSGGVLGGLLNSAIKRYLHIKDFSKLLGAHGGWLDRTDSVYLTVSVAYFCT